LVDDKRWQAFERKQEAVERLRAQLAGIRVRPAKATAGVSEPAPEVSDKDVSLLEYLRRPGVDFDAAVTLAGKPAAGVSRETLRAASQASLADAVIEQVETAVKYAGYVARQQAAVERAAAEGAVAIPPDFDYGGIQALSIEVRQILSRLRPETLADAARLSGVTPAAIAALRIHLKKARRRPPVADAA